MAALKLFVVLAAFLAIVALATGASTFRPTKQISRRPTRSITRAPTQASRRPTKSITRAPTQASRRPTRSITRAPTQVSRRPTRPGPATQTLFPTLASSSSDNAPLIPPSAAPSASPVPSLGTVSSANWNPNPNFCSSPSAFMIPGGGLAAEIIEDPPVETDPAEAFVGNPGTNSYFTQWPTELPANPECSSCGGMGPFRKNMGERNVLCSGFCIWRSPGVSESSCLLNPSSCTRMVTYYPPPPYTPSLSPSSLSSIFQWRSAARSICGTTYPNTEIFANISTAPPPGQIFSWVSNKCGAILYSPGSTYVQLTDEWQNIYLMHASDQITTAANLNIQAIALPPGWTVEKRVVGATPLVLWPLRWDTNGATSDVCLNVILRDNLGNGYHQLTYGTTVLPEASIEGRRLSVVAESALCVERMVELGLLI